MQVAYQRSKIVHPQELKKDRPQEGEGEQQLDEDSDQEAVPEEDIIKGFR